MNKPLNKKAVVLVILTILLAGIAIGSAFWLYSLNTRPVAPTAPESKPAASAPDSCEGTGT
ncbi:MAG: hypothetical protein AAB590_03625, partial [Patescibacteria group bacterium]